jgi:hypothetical protein
MRREGCGGVSRWSEIMRDRRREAANRAVIRAGHGLVDMGLPPPVPASQLPPYVPTPTPEVTGVTIESVPEGGRPRKVILNMSDGSVRFYQILSDTGISLGNCRYFEVGNLIVGEPPPAGLGKVRAAVRSARGGDAPVQVQGYA